MDAFNCCDFESVRRMAEIAAAEKLARIRSGKQPQDDGNPADLVLHWEIELAASSIDPVCLQPLSCCHSPKTVYSIDGGVFRRGKTPPDDEVNAYGFCGRCISH